MSQLSLLPDLHTTGPERVYYATDFVNIKIGRTANPRRRGGELAVEMLFTIPGSELEERRQQRMWAKYRIGRTEWFRANDEMLLWLMTQLIGSGPRPKEMAILQQLIRNMHPAVAA